MRLARSRLLPDQFYAVKVLHKAKLGTSAGRHELRALDRERELLMTLARECRGTHHRDFYVRLIAAGQDRDSLQLVMPAVLGGELFNVLEEEGPL